MGVGDQLVRVLAFAGRLVELRSRLAAATKLSGPV